MKRLLALLLVVVMCVGVLASCGKKKKQTTPAQTTEPSYVYEDDVAVAGKYTYNTAMQTFPTNWNPHIYQTNTDATILDYTTGGFYTFDYNETKDGYKLVLDMASAFPIDVTASYVGQYGVKEGDTAKVWKIPLRSDLKWQNGDAITAADFVKSAIMLLNPVAANYRADSLYETGLVIHNAKAYLFQDQTVYNEDAAKIADQTKQSDGTYKNADGDQIFFALKTGLSWLDGDKLFDYVEAYGDTYFGMTAWEPLKALADANGYVAVTDESIALMTTLISTTAWSESAADVPNYIVAKHYYPVLAADKVGIFSEGNNLYIALDTPLSGFYLHYNLSSTWLVHEATYKANEKVENGVYTNTYGTAANNYMSYGPYKLTEFQQDKIIRFAKNENWYGYGVDENEGLYQTTDIRIDYIQEASTRLEMFLKGKLDAYGLSAEDMADYQMSNHTYFTTGESTFFMAFNPDPEALAANEKTAGPNKDKEILTLIEFRQALSFALDRMAFCLATSPTNSAAFGVFSSLIISNPETGEAYRTTEQAKKALVKFWGLENEIGADKLYANIDEAIESITGYDPAGAKVLFNAAYDKAIAEGLMDTDDVIEIKIGIPNSQTSFYKNGSEFLKNNYTEAVKGTKLEGKLTFTVDDTLGNAFADKLRDNSVDMLFGVGWTGSALDPYGLVSAYTYPNYQYDPSWDTSTVTIDVTLSNGTFTATVIDWTDALAGQDVKIKDATGALIDFNAGSASGVSMEDRLTILAALEGAILNNYTMVPMIDDASAALKGMQIKYYTEEYIYGVGRGGVKYMTYYYDDVAWNAYVSAQGGTLNYK